MNLYHKYDEKFDPETIYQIPEGIVNREFFQEKIKCPFCGIMGRGQHLKKALLSLFLMILAYSSLKYNWGDLIALTLTDPLESDS